MKHSLIIALALSITGIGIASAADVKGKSMSPSEKATFAGGCFWCMESAFDGQPGVVSTVVGYTGGQDPHPDYEKVCSGESGHAEAIEIVFDPTQTSFEKLLDIYWHNVDPTTLNQSFADRGTQYRSSIFYHSDAQKLQAEKSKNQMDQSHRFPGKIVTEVVPAETFYPAEDYHQKYYLKNALSCKLYHMGSGRDSYFKKIWGSSH